MLTLANLSFNAIQTISDLSNHRFLECLLLANNRITKIEGLSNLRFLQVNFLFFNDKDIIIIIRIIFIIIDIGFIS
jgi:Leucine-rich repeat (LRR) protein